jgi:iduronate 2-sulfatase
MGVQVAVFNLGWVLKGEPSVRNVLFICVDDLRPELNCYGKTRIVSPNVDALAAGGYQFNRAYIQQAICCPVAGPRRRTKP